ncbi:MAG: hypothetical protein Q8O22_02620 [Candidatus Omnitrophota bacterium]|nr:hypothetical protein [Candidatus Omnitrophota bacterium]
MKKTLKDKIIKLSLAISLSLSAAFCWRVNLYAEVPRLINYQGRAVDRSGKSLEQAVFTFRIYNEGGKLLWDETRSDVIIKKGVFNILLGAVSELKLKFDEQYYLEILINGQKMEPRQKLCSVGYVYRSEFADNDLPSGAVIMWSGPISSMPAGWVLCDGANGTPDLRDKFIIGAGFADQNGIIKTTITGIQTQTGGAKEVSLALENIPAHRHFNPAHTHTGPAHSHKGPLHQHLQSEHTHAIGSGYSGSIGGFQAAWLGREQDRATMEGGGGLRVGSAGAGTTSSSGQGETNSAGVYAAYEGSAAAQNNLPPYYALAFIMKK